MKQVVQSQQTGKVEVAEVPAPAARPGGVLVRTAYSLISAGTERAKREIAQKNLVEKALARPDQVRQVLDSARTAGVAATIQKVRARLESLDPLGYSSAGIVVAIGEGVGEFAPGDRVACAGAGYANHAEYAWAPRNLCAAIPDGVSLDEAAYGTVGAIALQGVRQALPTLGEVVGVIGLGLVGLLAVQLLRAAGCRVIGIDIDPGRCDLARTVGADGATRPDDPSLDRLVQQHSPAGLDAVLLTAATQSNDPVRLAARLCRDRGRVVVVGDLGLDLPRAPFYDKELELRLSRSYGPGRYDRSYEEQGIDYPIGYVRWTENRNLTAFLDLVAQRKIDLATLTTHRFTLDQAEAAYDVIEGKSKQHYLGVLLDYQLTPGQAIEAPTRRPVVLRPPRSRGGTLGLGLIGAGNFAQAMLLPHLRSQDNVELRTVVTPSGLTARSVADRVGFAQCASDPEAVFADPAIDLVVIASRHGSHAGLVRRAIEAGKAVFVEKPLALSPAQLDEVIAAYGSAAAPFAMVGFNRRFAPLVVQLREFFATSHEPLLISYRANAGFVPRQHWTQDPVDGGGRIVGEVCHFVDLARFLVGQPVTRVVASGLPDGGRYSQDNVAATLQFADGSAATILYAANGDRGVEKERIEVFGGGRAAVLDDFRSLGLAVGGKRTTHRSGADKGHRAEMQALVRAVAGGAPEPILFAESVEATRVTFALLDSLASGQSVELTGD